MRGTVDALAAEFEGTKVDAVLGVEARGFIFAPALAYHLGVGFVPVRKPRKLPAECASISYDLEYGQDTLEIHRDAIGERTPRANRRRPASYWRHGQGRRRFG